MRHVAVLLRVGGPLCDGVCAVGPSFLGVTAPIMKKEVG